MRMRSTASRAPPASCVSLSVPRPGAFSSGYGTGRRGPPDTGRAGERLRSLRSELSDRPELLRSRFQRRRRHKSHRALGRNNLVDLREPEAGLLRQRSALRVRCERERLRGRRPRRRAATRPVEPDDHPFERRGGGGSVPNTGPASTYNSALWGVSCTSANYSAAVGSYRPAERLRCCNGQDARREPLAVTSLGRSTGRPPAGTTSTASRRGRLARGHTVDDFVRKYRSERVPDEYERPSSSYFP